MWIDPGFAGLFITSTLLHLGEDINLLVMSVPLHVCFFVIVPRTLVIDVLTLHLTTFIFLVMYASMNMCFHLIILNILQRSRTQPAPNLPLSPSRLCSTTHHYPLQIATIIQLYHSKQPPYHSLHPSPTHHPMYVYLTIMMQVQLVNWSYPSTRTHPFLALGQSIIPPLLRPSWPTL